MKKNSQKKFGGSKITCTFALPLPKEIFVGFVCAAIFIASNTAKYADNIRLPIHNGCCALKPVIFFGETWKGSLSSFNNFSFSFMPKKMKDYSDAKHSTVTVTPDCESVNNYLNLLPKAEQNTQDLDANETCLAIARDADESKIDLNTQKIDNVEGSGVVGNNLTGSDNTSIAGNDNLLNPQTNNVENNTGITGITGTGHTIIINQCPPELLNLLLTKLT
jgi:hypothetical protein